MKHFLLLLKGKTELDYSPEELQKRMEEYRQWAEELGDLVLQDNRLERTGVMIEQKGVVKTDGPFLETKEIIAGFIIIQAESLDRATRISEDSPLLKYFQIIIRPMVMPI
ncbi:MAG: hypothetical protein HEP71_26560 [Roseivirga sp.]|nr:hypothetical protein [Roseivirga sp.]